MLVTPAENPADRLFCCQTHRMHCHSFTDRPLRRLAGVFLAGFAAALMGLSASALAQVPDTATTELTLYGLRLKDASAEAFVAAASADGAQVLSRQADGTVFFDVRAAGVPALQRLTLITDQGALASAQFVIKPYGQDNEALRQLLVKKYGLPFTAEGARRPFPAFAARFAPRGSFDWDFAGGMKLIYRQPVLGDSTLSYTDVERARRRAPAVPLPARAGSASDVPENRF